MREMKILYRVLIRKPEGKRLGWEFVDLIYLIQKRDIGFIL